ncbi:MAG: hypothetical protein KKH88_00970 [Nanoarchaeota archaeon]|nr:hypothetical protein [Nanoarchaeota archaeon]
MPRKIDPIKELEELAREGIIFNTDADNFPSHIRVRGFGWHETFFTPNKEGKRLSYSIIPPRVNLDVVRVDHDGRKTRISGEASDLLVTITDYKTTIGSHADSRKKRVIWNQVAHEYHGSVSVKEYEEMLHKIDAS